MIALYGGDVYVIRQKNYSLYVSLWLYRERSRIRKSLQTLDGIRGFVMPALGKAMEPRWFSHVTETDDQALFARESQTPRAGSTENDG